MVFDFEEINDSIRTIDSLNRIGCPYCLERECGGFDEHQCEPCLRDYQNNRLGVNKQWK